MILYPYTIHLFKDMHGQRRNAYIEIYAESPVKAIDTVRNRLRKMASPVAKWKAEAKLEDKS
jgi:hypothetical protein